MQIAVAGPRGGSVPTDLGISIHTAAKHYARQLGIGGLHTTVLIRAHHKSTIDGVCEGLCEPLDTRHFRLDVCLYANWLQILAHEMVHIKQFARNELDTGSKSVSLATRVEDVLRSGLANPALVQAPNSLRVARLISFNQACSGPTPG